VTEPHDVHLIFNNRERDTVAGIDQQLRNRGLIPWFWDKDAGPNWYQDEVDSIEKHTPVSAIFIGSSGWGPQYHTQLAGVACRSGRPTIFVLLPGFHGPDLDRFPQLRERRWVEFTSADDRSALDELAQRVVDGAYEGSEKPAVQAEGVRPAPGRRLMVYVPARSQTVESWTSLRDRLSAEPALAGCAWYGHGYRAGVWSDQSLEGLAGELAAEVAGAVESEKQAVPGAPIQHITLMGHSFGGVLARTAYLIAAGRYRDWLNTEYTWWPLVDRIVLFATPNRGIEKRRFEWRDRLAIEWPFGKAGQATRDQIVGSEAITNLRISWIRFWADLPPGKQPTVVQLLGRGDQWVNRDDSLDIEQLPNAWQSDVPGASHADVHQVAEGDAARYAILRQGILEAKPPGIAERRWRRRNPVVIVLHGIRANNETWAEQVRTLIEQRAPNALAVAPTYGYLPMLDFALPWLRARKARALQAQYSDLLVQQPRARFCFVGHSNGTYMLGRSLLKLAGMRFDRVTLAASVLPRDYHWATPFGREQVRQVSNHRASRDVPVGIVCNLLRALGAKDVGTAGFHGFLGGREEIREVYYYEGGHSAPVVQGNLESLVDYTLTGRAAFPLAGPTTPRGQFVSRLSESTIVGLLVFAVLCAIVFGLTWALVSLLTVLTTWSSLSAIALSVAVVLVFVYLLSRYY
jgi:alpha-beta hydrolase superfamily lysophospholipase